MRNVLLTLGLALVATMLQAADFKWAMITQKGQTLFMNNVGYILNSAVVIHHDGERTASVAIEDISHIIHK